MTLQLEGGYGSTPSPWKRRLAWTLAIIVGVLFSLWAISATVDLTIWGAYNHFIETLSAKLLINSYLANAISLIFIVPFFIGVKYYVFSLRDRKRKQRIGLGMLLTMGVAYNLALYVGTRDTNFDASSRAVRFYALIPGGVVFSDRPGTEAKYGIPFRPVSQENVKWLLRIKQGRIQVVDDPRKHDWFDGITGDPLLWYSVTNDGQIRFFDGPGHDPATGAELKPVTPEIRQEWETKIRAAEGNQPQINRMASSVKSVTHPRGAGSMSMQPELNPREKSLSDFKSLINSRAGLVPGKRNVAIAVTESGSTGNFSPQQALLGHLRSDSVHFITDLFRHDVFSHGYFDDMYRGDPEMLRIATSTARVDALILGRLSYVFRKSFTVDSELVSCEIGISYIVANRSGDVIRSDSFRVVGSGFSESEALERAIEILGDQFSNRALKAF